MLNYFIILLYLLILFGVGIYYRSTSTQFKNYSNIHDKHDKNILILVATIFASSIGGGTTIGLAEKAFASNISFTYGLVLSIPVDILIAKYLVPKIVMHRNATTVGDIIAKYYGLPGRFVAGFAAIVVSIGLLAVQINVSGHILQYILKVNYIFAMILSYGIVVIYTTVGGFRSVVFTNVLQFFAMILAIPGITIVGINYVGIQDFMMQLPINKILPTNDNSLISDTITAALGFAVMGLYPTFIQRTLISNDAHKTSKAIYLKSIIYFIFLIFVTLNGLIAYNLFPDQPASLVIPHLINAVAPIGIQGIIIIGLLAAAMSTADADLNIASITLVRDFFEPIFGIHNQRKLLYTVKVINVLIGCLAIITALSFGNAVDLVIFIAGFWGPVVVVPLTFALFDIVIPVKNMIFYSICGAISFLMWEKYCVHYVPWPIKGTFVGIMVHFCIFYAHIVVHKIRCNHK